MMTALTNPDDKTAYEYAKQINREILYLPQSILQG